MKITPDLPEATLSDSEGHGDPYTESVKYPSTLTAAVFTAAANATRWTSTNLGPRTEITHAGYTWTVELPAEGQGNARIAGRYGYGGTELLDVPATPVQTIGIVEAAVSALHVRLDTAVAVQWWEVENFGDVISVHESQTAAKKRVRQLLLIGRANPHHLTVTWSCTCLGADDCGDCQDGLSGEQTAFLKVEGCAVAPTSYNVRPAA